MWVERRCHRVSLLKIFPLSQITLYLLLGSHSRAAEVYLCLEAHRKCMIKIRIAQNFFMFSLSSYVFVPQFYSLNKKDKVTYVINPSI